MNFLKHFEAFSNETLTVPEMAWLYFLSYSYGDRGLEYDGWKNDKRMNNVKCEDAMQKCVNLGYATFENKIWKHTDLGKKKVDEFFYTKDLIQSLKRQKEFEKYDNKSEDIYKRGYTISHIPYEIWLWKNPAVEKSFERMSDLFTTWWNKVYHAKTAEAMFRNRHIKFYNAKQLFRYFDGEVPSIIKLYRGITSDYRDDVRSDGYSSWTLSYDQAERFASYHFTGGMQFTPNYSTKSIILEKDVTLDTEMVVISGDEAEVILKNPVKDVKVTVLDYNPKKRQKEAEAKKSKKV